ncbi:SMP-30/gluconolactonase/LRE family protein [Zoogloea sp.]|uniref:SMP-30/gluconolactonase/LRE family protein n=1 Tax=Zoogloea sp. TaxID=49181 RepID=UPI0026285958|nr:SMP-30/gluconolactonase/LRE family protein [Zoogloea sp.]MDD3352652.1 SMP-30/gluconolactonase/LRE family protein [Zoogloea sp.]
MPPIKIAPCALSLVAASLLGSWSLAHAQQAVTPGIAGVVQAGTPIELIQEGFKGTEGPIAAPDGGLLFTENQNDRIIHIAPDGRSSVYLEGANGSNALAFAPNGELISVQTREPRVGVIQPKGHARTLVGKVDGKFNLGRPNDLVVDRKGTVYFTDSGVNPAATPQPDPAITAKPAVYRVSPEYAIERLAADITRPNGIQLSPDEKTLYVANTAGEHVLAYDIAANGKLGPKREFARLEGFRQTDNGPTSGADGLAVDAEGRLYVASNAGVQVFSSQGQALGIIPLPKRPQNLAFAGPGKKTLYVVGSGSAWHFPVLTAGHPGRVK